MPTKPLRLPSAGTSPTKGEARVKAYIYGGAEWGHGRLLY